MNNELMVRVAMKETDLQRVIQKAYAIWTHVVYQMTENQITGLRHCELKKIVELDRHIRQRLVKKSSDIYCANR